MLTDMNAHQIARLGDEFAVFNRVFREREDILAWFGYRIMQRRGEMWWNPRCTETDGASG